MQSIQFEFQLVALFAIMVVAAIIVLLIGLSVVFSRHSKQLKGCTQVTALPNPEPEAQVLENSYEHAIELVKQGCTVAEIVHRCNLNWGEAELLVAIHH